jgi:hypothetical protein
MNEREFKNRYHTLKSLIEELDPAGFGAANEYDDILFKIIRDNENITGERVFSENVTRLISEAFGLETLDLTDSCNDFAEEVFRIYPTGLSSSE